MRTSARRMAGTGLAALLIAAGTAGCGGEAATSSADKSAEETPNLTPAAAVAKAVDKSEEITSLHFRMEGTTPTEGAVEGEAKMSLDPTVAISMSMTGEGLGEVPGETATVEMRLVDEAMYMSTGEPSEELEGMSWIKFDLSGAGEEDMNEMPGMDLADKNPAAESAFLTQAEDLKKVGTEKIEGVETTHYAGTVTLDELRKAMEANEGGIGERQEVSLESYEEMGLEELAMDIWVDEEDQTRQFRVAGDGKDGEMDMTFTFVGINEKVEVTAPPADETLDLMEMFGDEAV
ncbi:MULTISPECIES: LppX_LprAFG lipoprotein [unclassified Streptomyces]|uniref:LppX_LprAFG lipoprotein n=1 Tax=unclassified Streptomyces TaxID=2593676 RepID=UPI001906B319|nr:LppX_LprAFG lipoprotein [Streptomyces sp. HSG2]